MKYSIRNKINNLHGELAAALHCISSERHSVARLHFVLLLSSRINSASVLYVLSFFNSFCLLHKC